MSLTYSAGFFGISFAYASFPATDMAVTVSNGTGTVLASAIAEGTGLCERNGIPRCGDPGGIYGIWRNVSLRFEGVATSARFLGAQSASFIDNIELLLEPPPPTSAPTSVPTKAPTSTPTSTPSSAPTGSPTNAPTSVPTKAPTSTPTSTPSSAPTGSPTNAPTSVPTKAPTSRPTCSGATHWIYNPLTNTAIRMLANNSATCLVHPYSIEVRPCGTDQLPVTIRLVRASDGRLVHRQRDGRAPFYLFGDIQGQPRPSPKSLPNGSYRMASSAGGTIVFTQSCPCPKGKKGMKGCMK
jgi:cytoskeletal protein RodZ